MTLGLTTIQKNRAPWLREWIAFHYLVGFRKFYFYADDADDQTIEVLSHLKKTFDIEVFEQIPDKPSKQLGAYNDAYTNYGGEVEWMAFLDGDEFLFPTKTGTLSQTLQEFSDKDISALGVYWACYGSSGHIKEPEGLIIENYKYRAKDSYENNRHIKSLVRGGLGDTVQAADPHIFHTPNGTFDENLRRIDRGWTEYNATYDKLRINHYVTQSRTYFLDNKFGTGGPDGGEKRDESWWLEHDVNEIKDTSIDRFIEPLEKLTGNLG